MNRFLIITTISIGLLTGNAFAAGNDGHIALDDGRKIWIAGLAVWSMGNYRPAKNTKAVKMLCAKPCSKSTEAHGAKVHGQNQFTADPQRLLIGV